MCVLDETDALTVQWTGAEFGGGPSIQFQAVLHPDGTIDIVYGPDHAAAGAPMGGTLIGVENADGTIGVGAEVPVFAGETITFVPTS